MVHCERWSLDSSSLPWREAAALHYTELQGYLPDNKDTYSEIGDSKGKKYYYLSEAAMRKKFAQLALTGLVTHSVMSVMVIIHDVVLLLLCALPVDLERNNQQYKLIDRVKNSGLALVHILTIPLFIIGLQGVALIGIFYPENMRKSYAQFEKWIYIGTNAVDWKPVKAYLTLAFFPTEIVDAYAEENVKT